MNKISKKGIKDTLTKNVLNKCLLHQTLKLLEEIKLNSNLVIKRWIVLTFINYEAKW